MASEIIQSLGGNQAVADMLGVKRGTVAVWQLRGVPWRYRPALAAALKRRRIAVPDGFLVP
jgi:hypothetical protein